MNITIAIDSLKGSLSSLEAGHAIEEGIRRVYKDAAVNVRPLADGGEGTVEALACGMGGTLETVTVTGPMGRPVDCQYGILPESGTAIIEMSGAAGITLVPDAEKDPMKTTTFGVGEVIRAAIQKGCRRFIVGIGGSATNDGGAGMLQALGYGILDRDGNQILREPRGWHRSHPSPPSTSCRSFRNVPSGSPATSITPSAAPGEPAPSMVPRREPMKPWSRSWTGDLPILQRSPGNGIPRQTRSFQAQGAAGGLALPF